MRLTKILEFPAIAATDAGTALMTFTLNGPDYYPSTAYIWLTSSDNTIHITALGKSPEDGFTEYQFFATAYGSTYFYRPRWGDYSGLYSFQGLKAEYSSRQTTSKLPTATKSS